MAGTSTTVSYTANVRPRPRANLIFLALCELMLIWVYVYSCKNTLISLKMAWSWLNTSGLMDTTVFAPKQWYDKL